MHSNGPLAHLDGFGTAADSTEPQDIGVENERRFRSKRASLRQQVLGTLHLREILPASVASGIGQAKCNFGHRVD